MLEILTQELPNGVVGENYYVQLMTNCNKPFELKWKIDAGGVLPKNLIFKTDGIICGIPERAERADFYFIVINQNTAESAGKNLKLSVIQQKPDELKILTKSIPDAIAGVAYNFKFECSGGVPPYVWFADDLPAGLYFENGTIKGTAKFSGGASPISIKLRDSESGSAECFYFITVR